MLTLTQLQCVVHHDICHTLQIVEYNQTKITLSCDQSDHSQFIIQISYSQFKINPQAYHFLNMNMKPVIQQ